jgi:hypothetical protein
MVRVMDKIGGEHPSERPPLEGRGIIGLRLCITLVFGRERDECETRKAGTGGREKGGGLLKRLYIPSISPCKLSRLLQNIRMDNDRSLPLDGEFGKWHRKRGLRVD